MFQMQVITQLNILNDFSEYPKLRYSNLSQDSAEEFYHKKLNPIFAEVFSKNQQLEVNIDYTAGYTSSFLDEAFGNLIYDFGLDIVIKHLIITSNDEPYWLEMIKNQTYPEWEKRRKDKKEPKKTISHTPWSRLIEGKIEKKIWINV